MGLDSACQVDIICGDHLLERVQTLKETWHIIGDAAMQDGLLILHYGPGFSFKNYLDDSNGI